jgi:hypothetical protein
MQFVSGWEKSPPAIDMSSLVEPLFLCHCLQFIAENIQLAEKGNYLTPEFMGKVQGILKLLKPIFDDVGLNFDELTADF